MMPLMMATGCLNRSLLMVERAICMPRVSFVIRDMRKPAGILLKKSIEWRTILLNNWMRTSVMARLLEQIAADSRERNLHAAGIVRDPRHEEACRHLIKEIHRMAHHFV